MTALDSGPAVVSEGVRRIAAERQRQVNEEGFRAVNDDACNNAGSLAKAAACYALPLDDPRRIDAMAWNSRPEGWPWDRCFWKPAPVTDDGAGNATVAPADRIRELEKAGALLAAEIDRLLRVLAKGGTA